VGDCSVDRDATVPVCVSLLGLGFTVSWEIPDDPDSLLFGICPCVSSAREDQRKWRDSDGDQGKTSKRLPQSSRDSSTLGTPAPAGRDLCAQ
jgi:hypothetical protein